MTILYTSKLKGLWKTHLLLLLAFAMLALAPKAFAFSENWDSCSTGPASACAGWSGAGTIIDTNYYSSPNSVVPDYVGPIHSDSATSTTAYLSIWFYQVDDWPYNLQDIQFGGSDFTTCPNSMYFDLRGGTLAIGSNTCSYTGGGSYSMGVWNHLEMTQSGGNCLTELNGSTIDIRACNFPISGTIAFWGWPSGGQKSMFDDIYISPTGPAPTASYLTIDSPTSGSYASSSFSLDFTYNFVGENANKMYIVFEAWNASSTCPLYGTPEWQTQYSEGWFYNQSLPYFSPRLTATSTEATSSIAVYNLEQPYTYNCNYCYFYNEDTATSTLVNKCPDYLLNVQGYIPPSQPLLIRSWPSYYASHTDSRFPTSTAIFDTISGSFSGIVDKLTSFINDFRSIFDAQSANTNGSNLGQKIPLARGYLKPINDFFGSFPVSELFMLVLLVLLVVVLYRIVARILHLIRG